MNQTIAAVFIFIFALPAFSQLRLIKYGQIKNEDFQMQYGKSPRPSRSFSPTFIVYRDAGWEMADVIPQLKIADFLLQQCGIGIESPRLYYVEAPNTNLAASYFSHIEEDIYERIGFIINHPDLTKPIVLFLNSDMYDKQNTLGWSDSYYASWESAQERFNQDPLYGHIEIAREFYDSSKMKVKLAKKIKIFLNFITTFEILSDYRFHNTLAHELVHSLSGLKHKDGFDNLMDSYGSAGYINEDYCEAMRQSPILNK
jgi:hypothetical protein